MQLERIAVVLRPRTPREALDLGAVMLRANARAVWSAWFVVTLPAFVLCNALGVALGLPWLGWVLMWWLKPLFDRIPLYVLSRAVFDRAPSWRETLRGQREWGWARTLAALTWLRIDSHRALRLPLDLLEGAPRKQRAARWKVLRRRLVGETSLLTYGCLQFELVLFLSAWMLAAMLIPHEWRPESLFDLYRSGAPAVSTSAIVLTAAVAYLAMSVIEPLYVACGFALYLNRRTQLEAWDVDLAFRRLRHRLQSQGKLPGLLLACVFAWPLAGHAATAEHPKPAVSSPQQVFAQAPDNSDRRFADAAAQAYRDPRFGGERHEREWVFKYTPAFDSSPQGASSFAGFAMIFALIFKALMWLAIIAAMVFLLRFGWRWRGRWAESAEVVPLSPERLQAREPATAPLPADLAAATRALWQAQRRREALALLYRGCLEQTATLLHSPPRVQATEADWLRQAATIADPERAQKVVAIVRAWQFAAYAGRFPGDADIERLLRGWPAQSGASA